MKLNLFFGGLRIATIEGDRGVDLLVYSDEFENSAGRFSISPKLPVTQKQHQGDSVNSFFENMVPEGEARPMLFQTMRLNSDDLMSYLEKRGMDLPVGWVLSRSDIAPTEGQKTLIDRSDLKKIIEEAEESRIPLIASSPSRMSLAGAQQKMGVIYQNDEYFMTDKSSLTTHILKPNNVDYPNVDINEYAVMKLAKAVGLPVPGIFHDKELESFVIERFDRVINDDGSVVPLPHIDFCQAIGLYSSDKYESVDSNHVRSIRALLDQSKTPMVARISVFQRFLFDVMVGNRDGHLKNFSLMIRGDSFTVAPAYDLVCTDAFDGLSRECAIAFGGHRDQSQLSRQLMVMAGMDIGLQAATAEFLYDDMQTRIMSEYNNVLDAVVEEIGDRSIKMIEGIKGAIRLNHSILSEMTAAREKLSRHAMDENGSSGPSDLSDENPASGVMPDF